MQGIDWRTNSELRLSRALTVLDNTNIYDACRRLAARKVDALLLTDANALLWDSYGQGYCYKSDSSRIKS